MAEQLEPQEVIDDPIEVRRNKRQALIDAGQSPYAVRFDVSDYCADLEARYSELEDGAETEDRVAVAGRIMAIRNQGKVAFIVIRDGIHQRSMGFAAVLAILQDLLILLEIKNGGFRFRPERTIRAVLWQIVAKLHKQLLQGLHIRSGHAFFE